MDKLTPQNFAVRLPKASIAFGVCVCICLALDSNQPLQAQNRDFESLPQENDVVSGPEAEKQARAELAKLENLEITQRKARARQLIKKYPQTEMAKVLQRFLNELQLYDEAKQAAEDRAEARKIWIREYWKNRIAETLTIPNYQPMPLVRLTNHGDQAVLYQLRGYGMGWTHPLVLYPGETETVNYAVTYRRITAAGTVVYSLTPGTDYIFRQSEPGAEPRLFQAVGQK